MHLVITNSWKPPLLKNFVSFLQFGHTDSLQVYFLNTLAGGGLRGGFTGAPLIPKFCCPQRNVHLVLQTSVSIKI